MKSQEKLEHILRCSKISSKKEFTAINANTKNEEKAQINHLTLYLKELERQQQTATKVNKRKEIIKIRVYI